MPRLRPRMSDLLMGERDRQATIAQDARTREAVRLARALRQEREVARALYSDLGRPVVGCPINPPGGKT